MNVRGNSMYNFLRESKYIDFSAPIVAEKARTLFSSILNDIQKTRVAYEFVRDNIPHSFDINAGIVTAKASDVLLHNTGICHAKANLLAALLRSQGIPAGFCFQRITRAGDDSKGYCLHCYSAVWLDGHWIKLDARGNTNGKNAQFALGEPLLAFPCRPQYQEYFLPGIYAAPHAETMNVLERAASLQDVLENLPDAHCFGERSVNAMMRCMNCGSEAYRIESLFCQKCGTPLNTRDDIQTRNICTNPECNWHKTQFIYPDDARFCDVCGSPTVYAK